MSVADKMLKEIVTLAKKVARQEHETGGLWDKNQQLEDERDNLAAEVEALKTQLENAQRELSEQSMVANVETQQDAAAWQQQLDAARAETVEVRRRLNEEIDRHNATHCEKVELFQKLEWANQHAAELVKERDAALAAVSLQRAGIERLNTCLGKIRQHVAEMDQQEDLLCVVVDIRSALAELESNSSVTLTGSHAAEGGK